MKRYIYEQDAGHGWLGVPRAELYKLGIDKDISDYSYFDAHRATVWLEEDMDLLRFIQAKLGGNVTREAVQVWFEANVQERHVNGDSRIRSLPSIRQFRRASA